MTDYKLKLYLNDIKKENKIQVLNQIYSTRKKVNLYSTNVLNKRYPKLKKENNIPQRIKDSYSTNLHGSSFNNVKDTNKENVNSIIKDDHLDFCGKIKFKFSNSARHLGFLKNNKKDYERRLKLLSCNNYNNNDNSDNNEDEYDDKFDDNIDIEKENEDDIIKDLPNDEAEIAPSSNKPREPELTKQRNFFEESTDKLIFDELERKVFKNQNILERKEANPYTNVLHIMENKAMIIQKFFKKSKINKLLSQYKEKLYSGWDEEKENLIFLYKGEYTSEMKLASVFVKVYSLSKMLYFYETFNISELFNNKQSDVDLNKILNSIDNIKNKIISILSLKLSKNKKESTQETNEEEGYKFDENIPEMEENFSIHEERIKKVDSISSIQEVDYSNI